MKPIRMMIVDDLYEIRSQLATAITVASESQNPRIDVVGMACNGKEAIRLVNICRPDVILMDLEMPELGGLTAASRIKKDHPQICIIALTIHDSPASRLAVVQAGMDNLICKGASIKQIVEEVSIQKAKYDIPNALIQKDNDNTKGKRS